jgi:hypothetical protein
MKAQGESKQNRGAAKQVNHDSMPPYNARELKNEARTFRLTRELCALELNPALA